MKKIGIIGSGPVAKALGKGFLKYRYDVMLSSREPGKLDAWKAEAGENASTGTFADAAKYGDILVLAVAGSVTTTALDMAGIPNLAGKTIIDTTNPIGGGGPEDGVLHFTTTLDSSMMEQLQQRYAEANFVKAFNSVGNPVMVDPSFKEGKPTMFICGDNDAAKHEVRNILDQFGWETEDMGKATAARAIEPLCILWCIPGFLHNSWNHAFKLLKP